MRKTTKILVFMISILAFIFGVLFAWIIMGPEMPECLSIFSENAVNYISFIISFIAFVFSMITYFSIDSVSSITSMEGNVLENENYAISYEEVVDSFKDKENQKEFTEELLEKVKPVKRTVSCMAYADELQTIVDNLIWFAYLDLKDDAVADKCKEMIKIIEKENKRYDKLSNRVNHLFKEHVKLIKYVLKYQEKQNSKDNIGFSKLENVRGEMLINPVSKMVYYDYLGLDYRKKAGIVIEKSINDSSDKKLPREFNEEYMRMISENKYSKAQFDEFECLIEKASQCFVKAEEYASQDILWEGYISYNKLRVNLMRYLIYGDKEKEEILSEINNVIKIRKKVEILFGKSQSYLSDMFKAETKRAEKLKKNFQKFIEK